MSCSAVSAPGLNVRRSQMLGAVQGMPTIPLLVVPLAGVQAIARPWAEALVLGLGLFAHQGFAPNVFALATDITPARAIGSTIGIAAFCGNLCSIGLIQFQAYALGRGWGYAPALAICASSYLLALGAVQLMLPSYAPAQDGGVAP